MKVGINGLFLRKPFTGIGQVTEYTLAEWDRQEKEAKDDEKNTVRVYVDELPTPGIVSDFFQVRLVRPWWRRDDLMRKILWEYIQLPLAVERDGCEAFISLYQSPTIIHPQVRHTMVCHDVIPEIFPTYRGNSRARFLWRLTKKALQHIPRIVAVSWSTKNDLERYLYIADNKVSVAYPSIAPNFFVDLPQETEHKAEGKVRECYGLTGPYWYHGGGLEIRKNTETLLRSYKELLESFAEGDVQLVPDLVISGTIHPRANPLATDVIGLCQELSLEEKVKLIGFVPLDDLPALYRGAEAFLYPSLYEGFGLPVLEALSQGTKTLASAHSALPEVGGEEVSWVEVWTSETLRGLLGAQDTPEAQAARKQWAKKFTWQEFVAMLRQNRVQ
jgi:glycosyltransferase involved in cell wall biosynthesis